MAPCHTCPKPDLFDENVFVWELYAKTLWNQFRSDGMGGFIATDYAIFRMRCDDLHIPFDESDFLWEKVRVIDQIRRLEIQAKNQAPASKKPSSASSTYKG